MFLATKDVARELIRLVPVLVVVWIVMSIRATLVISHPTIICAYALPTLLYYLFIFTVFLYVQIRDVGPLSILKAVSRPKTTVLKN